MILLQAAGTGMSSLIMFGMIFAVMYFFMIRPQIKKQKKEGKQNKTVTLVTNAIPSTKVLTITGTVLVP